MSSIEKAMDKLAGRTTASATTATTVETIETIETDADAVVAAPVATTDRVPAAAPITPEPVAAIEAAPLQSEQEATPEDRTVWIDFPQLAARGNLVPGTALTREAEEYQYIKRRLLGNIALKAGAGGRPANLIMVTSSVPGEGKTFTSLNLSMSITFERDHTVLVVDTDIMKRDLSRQLNLEDRLGLYDYLDGQVEDIAKVIYRTNVPNLAIIPSGRFKAASTEMLASVRMRALVDEFSTRYKDRVVLFDTPPLLATSTAIALAPMVGQLVLVVEAGSTKRATVQMAVRTLDRSPITGLILNKCKGSSVKVHDYYGDYYSQQGATIAR